MSTTRRRRGSDEEERDLFPQQADPKIRIGAILGGMLVMLLVITILNRSVVNNVAATNLTLTDHGIEPESPPDAFGRWLRGLRVGPSNFTATYNGPIERVEMIREQLISGMDPKYRSALIDRLYKGEIVLNAAPNRLHGVVGINPDGTDIWTPNDPVDVSSMDMVKELRVGGGFNIRLSDSTPLDRDVSDFRDPACKRDWDISQLPRGSVIIIFHNEPRSTLFRSIHSVYNYTPPELLQEIILVDDGSTLPWTAELESTAEKYPKMKVLRMPKRSGIVAARTAGIHAVTAPAFFILDSHIEVQPQWMEPLLKKISEDRSVIVMPQVDGIDAETLKASGSGIGCTLGFLWKLIEHSFSPIPNVSPADRILGSRSPRADGGVLTVNEGVSSPTMAGGLFGGHKEFFLEDLGGYDMGFEYWGTENLELSFRIWQCGGRLECVPCSRVGHIFRRGGVGYKSPENSTTKNKLRLLTGWMDEYGDLAYKVLGQPSNLDFGDVSPVLKFRQEKNCKPFRWFLENVYPESHVIDLPQDVPYLGTLKPADTDECLTYTNPYHPDSGVVKIQNCASTHQHNTQFMHFDKTGWIMPLLNDESCLSNITPNRTAWCEHGNTKWQVQPVSTTQQSDQADTVLIKKGNKCLTKSQQDIKLENCNQETSQLWIWERYRVSKTWTPSPRG